MELAQSVLESMQDAVVVVSPSGAVLLANRAAYELLGYDHHSADLVGMPVREIIPSDQDPMRTSQLRNAMVGVDIREEAVTLRRRCGAQIPASIAGDALIGPDEDLVGVVLVARDQRPVQSAVADARRKLERCDELAAELVANKQELESDLAKVREQLLRAEHLATIGNLAGGVGHELQVISLILDIELDTLKQIGPSVAESPSFAELARAISLIKEHAERLLALSRPGPDHTAPVNLVSVFESVVRMLRITGKLARVDIETDFPDEPVLVTVNRTRIEQILINLLLNAVDAFEAPPRRQPRIRLSIAPIPHSQRIACRVEDNGCGIAPTDLDRIFDSYFSTKPDGAHPGMGLVVARQIVESYGGTLLVNSRVGSGTSFSFDLLGVYEP